MGNVPEVEGVTDLVEIGRGGFGVVYLGTETSFDRQVAVKVLMPSLDERSRRRFERERRAMGSVSGHPNIVTVYRGGLTPLGQPYLVMEYLRGGSLNDRMQTGGPLDWRQAATIGSKLSQALAVAHRAGILHRDVKPGNVFMTESGEPKLGDFGIARLDDGQDSRTGSITASIAHAPPEIVDGQRGDERSDLYSLASTVYAMTIGVAPFSQDSDQGIAALLGRIANDEPPSLHLETAATDFERCLRKALSKRPEDRHATVAEFGNELHRSAEVPVTANMNGLAGAHAVQAAHEPAVASPSPPASRSSSVRQMGFIALLALAIAGFGGWAVARAVLNSDGGELAQVPTPVATSVAEPTSAVEPTAVPPTPIPATPVPATPVPPTAVPATPTPTSGAGTRGSGLRPSSIPGYALVEDASGAISVEVPQEWSFTVQDSSTIDFDDEELATARVLSIGGTLQELSADIADRDLSRSGMYIFATRLGVVTDSESVLAVGLSFWSTCAQGEQSQILLADGNADFQILECERPNGESTGVVVLALVPRDDPDVGVSIFLQFAEFEDLESLPTILETLQIDPTKIP